GASGFLGSHWSKHLEQRGHDVVRLVRRPAGPGESRWDPYSDSVDLDLLESADVVANVAGAPLAHFPFNAKYRKTFLDSRVETTRVLAEGIAATSSKPAFVAQSGVAGYGDHGAEVVTEETPTNADSFLGRVTREWESATEPARAAGSRVVILRTSVVLDKRGGALGAMLLPFRLGVGGRIGSGEQYFATISLADWMAAAMMLAESETASGPYNLVAPGTTTNAEYTKTLARHLRRPAVIPVPEWPVKKVVPDLASELFGSIRLEPRRLVDEGFEFRHADLDSRLSAGLRAD
ncbi:MAG TPA: TIGR01777 family oxidoreductase, partial [Nocardioidaceae bacterium]|nr:TIGR01777 family oxidoreductase [Nocardioidaceae bacterium]